MKERNQVALSVYKGRRPGRHTFAAATVINVNKRSTSTQRYVNRKQRT